MSIRITSRINTRPFEDFADSLDNFNEIAAREMQEVYDDYKPVILQKLQEIPGAPKYPLEWTSEKQRRAFFASDGFGRGIGAPRTGEIPQAWDMELLVDPSGPRILIINRNPKAKFLYGGLSLRSNPRLQQRMHKVTGWPTAAPIVDIYLEAMQIEFIERFKSALSDFGSITGSGSRAYTGR